MLKVIRPGPLSTIQDFGRIGFAIVGVSRCGAMDRFALKTGQALLANSPSSAAIEIALGGFEAQFLEDTVIALTGAEMHAEIEGKQLWSGQSYAVKAGEKLKVNHSRIGMYAYLSVDGGFNVDSVMGSYATDINAGFGGYSGRKLVQGDHISYTPLSNNRSVKAVRQIEWSNRIRVLPSPSEGLFSTRMLDLFYASWWKVDSQSNRMATVLSGPTIKTIVQKSLNSRAVFSGVIQLPESGVPMVLQADAQSCGGYPEIGVVIEADLWKLAQARSNENVRFVAVKQDQADSAYRQWEHYFNQLEYSCAM